MILLWIALGAVTNKYAKLFGGKMIHGQHCVAECWFLLTEASLLGTQKIIYFLKKILQHEQRVLLPEK